MSPSLDLRFAFPSNTKAIKIEDRDGKSGDPGELGVDNTKSDTMSVLCGSCRTIFQGPFSDKLGGCLQQSHHVDFKQFAIAAASGCYICQSSYRRRTEVDVFLTQYAMDIDASSFPLLSFQMWGPETGPKDGPIYYIVPTGDLEVNLSLRNRDQSSFINDATTRTRDWLRSCSKTHEDCPNNELLHSYPSRLLELGESSFRILESMTREPSGPYIALSYCWGPNPKFLRLTSSNATTLRAGIPYGELPLAFQEVAAFAKSLGVQYLWIDALCIIQEGPGSAEDWRVEAARMHEVYSNAVLTIALASIDNPHCSIWSPWDGRTRIPFEVKTPSESCYLVNIDYYHDALYDQPLASRAWTLQEKVMASKVLSLGPGEVFWDCCSLHGASESFPSGDETTNRTRTLPELLSHQVFPGDLTKASNKDDLSKFWAEILHDCNQRNLTYPAKDELVAVSSISAHMAQKMDDVHIAGLFLRDLPHSLLWRTYRSGMETAPRQGTRSNACLPANQLSGPASTCKVPSWSWASMHGPTLQWLFLHERQDTEFQAQAVSYAFRRVDELDLAKSNTACDLGLGIQVELSLVLTLRAHSLNLDWKSRKERKEIAHDTIAFQLGSNQGNKTIKLKLDLFEEDIEAEEQLLFIVLVCRRDFRHLEGLVVRPKRGTELVPVYERVCSFGFDVGDDIHSAKARGLISTTKQSFHLA